MRKNRDDLILLIMFLTGVTVMVIAFISPMVTGLWAFILFLVGLSIIEKPVELLLNSIEKNKENEK